MNIEFLDETTVIITETLEWTPRRPKNKIQRKMAEIVNDFLRQNPKYVVRKVEGPEKISNFRDESQSSGRWVLRVRKTAPSKKTAAPKKTGKKSSNTRTDKEV